MKMTTTYFPGSNEWDVKLEFTDTDRQAEGFEKTVIELLQRDIRCELAEDNSKMKNVQMTSEQIQETLHAVDNYIECNAEAAEFESYSDEEKSAFKKIVAILREVQKILTS